MDYNDFTDPHRAALEHIARIVRESISIPPEVYSPIVKQALEAARPQVSDVFTDLWSKTNIYPNAQTWDYAKNFADLTPIVSESIMGKEWDIARDAIMASTNPPLADIFDDLDIEGFMSQIDFSSFIREWADVEDDTHQGESEEASAFVDEIATRLDEANPSETESINQDAEKIASELLKSMEMRAALVQQINAAITSLMVYTTETLPCRFLSSSPNRTAVVGLVAGSLQPLAAAIAPGLANFLFAIIAWIAERALDRFRRENCSDYLPG